MEVGPDDALRRARLLDFGDHGGLTATDPRPDGADEVARRRLRGSRRGDRGERFARPGGGDFLVLGGDDPGEDIVGCGWPGGLDTPFMRVSLHRNFAHTRFHAKRWVQAMNWSTLARAAPLTMAWRARSMPAAMLSARLAA